MHELGVVIEIAETVEEFARSHGVTKVDTLVLQIGELSSMIPKYIEDCFPAAVDGTILQNAKLRIEILPGNAICKKCGKVWRLIESGRRCPACDGDAWELLCGKEFTIKEIIAC